MVVRISDWHPAQLNTCTLLSLGSEVHCTWQYILFQLLSSCVSFLILVPYVRSLLCISVSKFSGQLSHVFTTLMYHIINHIFSLLSFISERREGFWKLRRDRWQVTRVVMERELGRPVERLREQLEKLQLHSAKEVMLEQQLAIAEERVRRLEGEKQAAETRAEIAERTVICIHW